MEIYYTGIGSRGTPSQICDGVTKLSQTLSHKGFVLRSGGANGADLAFENGAIDKQIYLPWKGFNNNDSPFYLGSRDISTISIERAKSLLIDKLPYFNSLKESIQKLFIRNVFQIVGYDWDERFFSKFVICWTKNGKDIGGTRVALIVARECNIPIFNFGKNPKKELSKLKEFINIL